MEVSLAGLSLKPKVGYVYDDRLLLHSELDHGELEDTPSRIQSIHSRMQTSGLISSLQSLSAVPADPTIVSKVHSETHVERLKDLALDYTDFFNVCISQPKPRKPGVKHSLGRDTYDNEHTSASRVDGFCFVNNVAVAAQYVIEELGLKRVMILDWDVHHGNGTQELFANRPDVLFISIHRYENGTFYPHTPISNSDYQGEGAGVGFSYNVAWNSEEHESKVTDGDYKAVMQELVMPLGNEFDPELVLVSCGFDAMVDDPLGGMHLTPWIFAYMTTQLQSLARCETDSGKLVIALEGGYETANLAAGSEAVVRALLEEDFDPALYPQ